MHRICFVYANRAGIEFWSPPKGALDRKLPLACSVDGEKNCSKHKLQTPLFASARPRFGPGFKYVSVPGHVVGL